MKERQRRDRQATEGRCFLIFFVEFRLISISADQDIRHPVWRAAHDRADRVHGDILAAFYDDFVMDMAADEAEGQVSHGEAEEVAGDCLDDVLHELRTVGFDPLPFFVGADSLIGDGFPAETIFSHLWLDVGEGAAGWEMDEKHPAFVLEADTAHFCVDPLFDGGFDCGVHIPPILHDVRICGAPRIYQRLQFIFGQSHFQGTH